MKRMILAFTILLLLFSGCVQEEKPKETAAPLTSPSPTQPALTPAPTEAPVITTLPPTTQPPTTVPPPTTSAPTTPPTTTPPPTSPPPAKILETYDVQASEDSNLRIVITGKIRNNGNEYQSDVRVIATLYDQYGQVIKAAKSILIEKLAPSQSTDFTITTDVLKKNVKNYELSVESSTIAPPATTPPPSVKELEVIDVQESITTDAKLKLTGKIKNTGAKYHFKVQLVVTLYDVYGIVITADRRSPIEQLSPGETKSVTYASAILRDRISKYTYEAISESTSA